MTSGAEPAGAPVDLLTIGETMALLTAAADGLAVGARFALSAGGAESNVAVGAAALGVRAAWLSRVGEDDLGAAVVTAVSRAGVDVAPVEADAARPTGLMVKLSSAAGSKVSYYRAGSAAAALAPADLARAPRARVVHTTGVTAAISATARALVAAVLEGALAPAVTSFDVNHRARLWPAPSEAASVLRELAHKADIVFVGRDEAEALWGTTDAESVRALLPDVAHLVVKDGAIEAVAFDGDRVTRVPAQSVEVIDPVGAGDAFAAGWLTAFLRGDDAVSRLEAGHASAATVLRSPDDTAAGPAAENEMDGAARHDR